MLSTRILENLNIRSYDKIYNEEGIDGILLTFEDDRNFSQLIVFFEEEELEVTSLVKHRKKDNLWRLTASYIEEDEVTFTPKKVKSKGKVKEKANKEKL